MAQGRIRRLITRRRLKWAGLVVASGCGVLFVATLWMEPTVFAGDRNRVLLLGAWRGQIGGSVILGTDIGPAESMSYVSVKKYTPTGFDLWFVVDERVFTNGNSTGADYVLAVPLWFLFLLIAAPTVYFWRTDRRAKPWQCPKCRYDLRGLEGGVCPECGKPTGRDA